MCGRVLLPCLVCPHATAGAQTGAYLINLIGYDDWPARRASRQICRQHAASGRSYMHVHLIAHDLAVAGRALRRRRPAVHVCRRPPEIHPRDHTTTRFVASSSMPCARARRRRRRRRSTRRSLSSPIETKTRRDEATSAVCVTSKDHARMQIELPAPKLSEAACTRSHRSMEPARLPALPAVTSRAVA